MPNHVTNEVRLHDVDFISTKPLIGGKNGAIDFETLVPLSINFWPGNVGREHQHAFPGTHLDEARAIWGTKWNAYHLGEDAVWKDGGDMVLTFDTAWSPPRGWIVALFNTLECKITHLWKDEGSDEVFREVYTPDNGTALGPRWDVTKVKPEEDGFARLGGVVEEDEVE